MNFHFHGDADLAARYIEELQLLDPCLWSLLAGQYRTAGADDRDLGWRGEYWGKMMRGAVYTYRYTRNPKLYTIMTDTVEDLLRLQDAEGRISTYSKALEFHGWDIWNRKYVMLGMEYYWEICRDACLKDRIVHSLILQADHLLRHIGKRTEGKIPITQTSTHWKGLNSSSVLEPILRLYRMTGEERFLAFGTYIIQKGGFAGYDLFRTILQGQTYPWQMPVTKAYEMTSCFEGILEYYQITGKKKYLRMAENFARLVMESDITLIGCAGTTHELFDHSIVHQFDPAYTGIMQETCVTVTWMKYLEKLLMITQNPLYADAIEVSYYNALLGAINVQKHPWNGDAFAFDSYSPLCRSVRGLGVGGYKSIAPGRYWGCCVAIGAAGTGLFPDNVLVRDKEGAVLHFYADGQAELEDLLSLSIKTGYPASGQIEIHIEKAPAGGTCLKIRIPAWSHKTCLKLNGQKLDAKAGSYAKMTVASSDQILLQLDLSLRVLSSDSIAMVPGVASRTAVQRGPVTFALDQSLGNDLSQTYTLLPEKAELIAVDNMRQAIRMPTKQGPELILADYASCGQSYDPALPVTVWM